MNKKTFMNELKKELKYYKKINSEEIIYYYDEGILYDKNHVRCSLLRSFRELILQASKADRR